MAWYAAIQKAKNAAAVPASCRMLLRSSGPTKGAVIESKSRDGGKLSEVVGSIRNSPYSRS
jgi:hypothetical protein